MTWLTFRHEAMATYFEIAIAGQDPTYARQAATAAFRDIDQLEAELSRFVETSDVARVNRLHRGETAPIGEALLECLLLAADVTLATAGRFDVAYATEGRVDPVPYSLDPDGHTLTSKAERLRIDLGALGKGYALDIAAERLTEWGATSACVVSGGSTAVMLDAPAGMEGWPIGIGDAPAIQHIPLRRTSLSASGVAVKGEHLIDPSTQRPAKRTGRVWALANSGAQSDALSTAFFVMTDAEVAAFCAAHPEIGAGLVGAESKLVPYGALRGMV